MNIFTIFMVVTIGLALVLQPRRGLQRKKIFCVLESIILVLIAALRSDYTADMARYAINFERVVGLGWSEVLKEPYHPGLYIFVKLISYISSDKHFVFGVLGAVFVFAISKLIYDESKDAMMSYIILVPMGYFGFILTGIAQGLAMSLLVFSYFFLKKKKYVWYVVFVLLATVCHTTAIIGFVLIVLKKMRLNKFSLMCMILVYGIIYSCKTQIGMLLISMANYREYEIDVSSGGIAELCIYLSILAVSIIILYKEIRLDENIRHVFWICFIGAVFFTFVPIMTEFFRLAMYFNLFIILMIPEIITKIKRINGKYAAVFQMAIYLCLFLMYFGFTNGSSSMKLYQFFWQV